MRINRKFIDEITKRLDIVSASGRSTVEQIMIGAPSGYDFDELYAYVKQNYFTIVQACANNAAAVGASAYDAYREIETGEALGAMPYSAFEAETTDNAVRSFVGQACDARDRSKLVDFLGRRIDSEVMRSYSNTHIMNGKADPLRPKYARVPTGNKPCDFCRALAGHGFYYNSMESAGDQGSGFNRFHDFCRCQVVPQFSSAAKALSVAGYDPEKYAEEWRATQKEFKRYTPKASSGSRTSAAMPHIDQPLLDTKPAPVRLPEKAYGGAWDQKSDMETFLKTMYEDGDFVGTCSEFYTNKDGRRVPTKGLYQRTAGQIENVLDNTNNVASAVGRYRVSDGAYVRINPLDGQGVSDENVKRFMYSLIECDNIPMEDQYGFVKALNLPTQTITTSGGKSLHAVVKIDATDHQQYKERVALLHAECKAAGFDVDASTKNPSRFMRIPGVRRGEGRQVLVSTHEGASSWDEWREWCETHRK